MSTLKGLTGSAGSGLQIGVVLPDTTSSTRWVDFDQPYLTTAFTAAGLSTSQFKIDNAQGSDATELSLATADISAGAKVLVFCPLDGPTGVAVAKLAEQKGVTLIAYDRAIFEGTKTYYVSFDNEKVGELIGNGFNQCLTDWKVKSPQVYVLNGGEDTDPNAISFASGSTRSSRPAGEYGTAGTQTLAATRSSERLRPRLGQHQGRHHLPAGVHRPPEDQRHHQGQWARQRGDHRPQDGRRQARVDADHRAGRRRGQGMTWILEGYQCGSVQGRLQEVQDAVVMAASYSPARRRRRPC